LAAFAVDGTLADLRPHGSAAHEDELHHAVATLDIAAAGEGGLGS
jgi:hypothetical protein